MTDDVRVWLVDRHADMRNMVTLTYATPAGDQMHRRQQSASTMRVGGVTVTAAEDVDPEALQPVEDADRREWFASEASRMASRHDPGDEI
jgi:hypothetical protein